MKDNALYKSFLNAFEPQFQEAVEKMFQSSHDTSFGSDLVDIFQKPLKGYLVGGKRVRPFLIAVGANSLEKKVIDAGIAFELIHTFALIHDDLMDGASKRRNSPTVHTFFSQQGYNGQAGAILLGDFILAGANEYLAKYVPECMPPFAKMQRFLCIGQFYEMIHWNTTIQPEVSEKIARFKSAQYTFMYPLQLGLLLASSDIHALDQYADATGLAFQIRDDWLDISNDKTSGKDSDLDSKNNVPNMVQNMHKKTGNLEATKKEVMKLLESYKQSALIALESANLTKSQSSALNALLEFSTTL